MCVCDIVCLAALRRHLVVKADRVRRQKREKMKLKAVFFEGLNAGRLWVWPGRWLARLSAGPWGRDRDILVCIHSCLNKLR